VQRFFHFCILFYFRTTISGELSTLWKGAPRQRRRRQLLLLITVYEGEQGQKTYAINEGEPMHGASLLVGCVDVRVLALSGTQKATGIFRGADFGEANLGASA
jgi:hypothetical protein